MIYSDIILKFSVRGWWSSQDGPKTSAKTTFPEYESTKYPYSIGIGTATSNGTTTTESEQEFGTKSCP
jgi:hypothetical protein